MILARTPAMEPAQASTMASGQGIFRVNFPITVRMSAATRARPNILVTGTPGTGKTTFAEALCEQIGFRFVNVGTLVRVFAPHRAWFLLSLQGTPQVREKGFHAGTDEAYDCVVLDEDSEDRVCYDLNCAYSFDNHRLEYYCRLDRLSSNSSLADSLQLLDEMETMLAEGGNVVDFHSSELFPERWFDVVLVLRTDNKVLFDRLVGRCAHVSPHT